MPRQTARRSLRIETLESRQLLTVGTTDLQQYALEKLNEARLNPAGAAIEVTTNLNRVTAETFRAYNVDLEQTRREIAAEPPKPPLAWNDDLAEAATAHSRDMAANNFQSHTGSDGSSLEDRLNRAGYTNRATLGENAFAYADSVDGAMKAFLVDYGVSNKGHRTQIFREDFKEVGVGIARGQSLGVGPQVITQNFGARHDQKPYLVGVVYDDQDGDGGYSVGEGVSDVTVVVRPINPPGETLEIRPWRSGGYQVQLADGDYEVLARRGDRVIRREDVTLNDANVKVDFVISDPWEPPATVARPTPTPRPAAEPVTAPTVKPVVPPVVETPAPELTKPVTVATPTPAPVSPMASTRLAFSTAARPNPTGTVTPTSATAVVPTPAPEPNPSPVVPTTTIAPTTPVNTPTTTVRPTVAAPQQFYQAMARRTSSPRQNTSGLAWSAFNWRTWNATGR